MSGVLIQSASQNLPRGRDPRRMNVVAGMWPLYGCGEMSLSSLYGRWQRTPNKVWRVAMVALLLGIVVSVAGTVSGLSGANLSTARALWFFAAVLAVGGLGTWCWYRVWRSGTR
jgi:hypothetical protein